MSERFAACLAFALRWEGGWSNHPSDRGGATMRGVIQRVYDAYRREAGLPKQSVRHLSEAELQAIYRRWYWDRVHGDDLPPPLDLILFDTGVNMGTGTAVKLLQKALGITVDGGFGAATAAALHRACALEVAQKYFALREARYRGIASRNGQHVFLKGWLNRLNALREAVAEETAPAAIPAAPPAPPVAPDPWLLVFFGVPGGKLKAVVREDGATWAPVRAWANAARLDPVVWDAETGAVSLAGKPFPGPVALIDGTSYAPVRALAAFSGRELLVDATKRQIVVARATV